MVRSQRAIFFPDVVTCEVHHLHIHTQRHRQTNRQKLLITLPVTQQRSNDTVNLVTMEK